MPSRILLTLLIVFLISPPSCRADDPLRILSFLRLSEGYTETQRLISLQVHGDTSSLTPDQLLVIAQPKSGPPIQLPVINNPLVADGIGISFLVDIKPLAGKDPANFTYIVSIPALPAAGQAKYTGVKMPPYHFTTAVSKDKADLYAFGSILAGVSTKPLYALEIKAAPSFEVGHHDIFIGGAFTLAANQSVSAPVDRSRVDPDAITGAFTLSKRFPLSQVFPSAISADLKPISGEFSRKFPASNLITKGNFTYEYRPFLIVTSRRTSSHPDQANLARSTVFFIYPGLGYELGKNLSQPHTLFSQTVDLTRWNTIARLTPTATAGIYLLQQVPTADSTYKLTFTAAYQPRIPFTLEPFVTTSGPAANLSKSPASARTHATRSKPQLTTPSTASSAWRSTTATAPFHPSSSSWTIKSP